MSEVVVVLNADYSFLSVTSWKNAVCLLIEGKAEALRETKQIVRNATRSVVVTVPTVIRLVKFIRSIFKSKVPYSKRNVFARDNQTCGYCGRKIENLEECTVDHVIPRAQGGKSSWGNCVTSCKTCNHAKADRTPTQAHMSLRFKPYQPTINEHIQYYTERYGIDKLIQQIFKEQYNCSD
jgi:5-methylcytosine-specific restriction endonuclease McrA